MREKTERRAWSEEEDKILKELYEKREIKRWAEISRIMEVEFALAGRNGKQCRERYHNHLQDSIKHEKWTPSEEMELVKQQTEVGNKWAQISRFLPGRSQNDIKNQFYSILRRGLRQINSAIRKQLKRYKQLQIGILNRIVQACEPSQKRKETSQSYNQHVNLKSIIVNYAFHSQHINEEEDLATIKKFIQGVKTMKMQRKTKCKKQEGNVEGGEVEKESDQIQSAELRDDCPIEEIKKEETQQKFRKNSLFNFTLETPQIEENLSSEPKCPYKLRKRSSFCSNHSFDLSSPKWTQFLDPFKVFDMQSTDNLSPRPQFYSTSPYFDQSRTGFGNYNQFYH